MNQILKIPENDKNLQVSGLDGGGMPIYTYRGKLFSGFIFHNYKSGSIATEMEYQNGFYEGWHREYYKNGKLNEEFKIHNNISVEGTYRHWDEDGNLIESF